MQAVGNIQPQRFVTDGLALRPLAQNHQLPFLGQAGKGAHQERQVLDHPQAGQRAQP